MSLSIKKVVILVLKKWSFGIKKVVISFQILAYLCEITSGKSRKVSLKDEYIYTRARLQTWTNLFDVHISRALFFNFFLLFFLMKNFSKKKQRFHSVFFLHSLMVIKMLLFLNDLFIGVLKQLNEPIYGSILRKELLNSINHRTDMILKERLVSIGHSCKTFCE